MAFRDFVPLNLGLMMNPYNWVVVFLMVAIAAQGLALIATSATEE